jgi:chemotaxis protein methyltransferase CheR
MIQINNSLLEKFRALIYENCGINQDKTGMLIQRLDKIIRKYNLNSYEQYYQLLTTGDNQQYWREFIDEITIHKSSFFRENHHFEFIRDQLRMILGNNPRIIKNNEIKVWSAGCATGEEPYTLGMVLKEWLPEEIAIKILATDISSRMLTIAQSGSYAANIKKDMDLYYLLRYFTRSGEEYKVIPGIKALITFRMFNLIDPFPFRDTFDIIFCRNVMIYFDIHIQQELVQKFYDYLTVGGLLLIGHSESLLNKQHHFQYIQPTIYLKQGRHRN